MSFAPIAVEFDSAEACVGDCCEVDPTCPPRMLTLHLADAVLNLSISCEDACSDCWNDGFSPSVNCWPDTGTMTADMGTSRRWTSSGLSCNVGSVSLECNSGNVSLAFASSACSPIAIPTVVVSVQNSPFMVVFTTSSSWFGYCGFDTDTGNCTAERTVTVTITE